MKTRAIAAASHNTCDSFCSHLSIWHIIYFLLLICPSAFGPRSCVRFFLSLPFSLSLSTRLSVRPYDKWPHHYWMPIEYDFQSNESKWHFAYAWLSVLVTVHQTHSRLQHRWSLSVGLMSFAFIIAAKKMSHHLLTLWGTWTEEQSSSHLSFIFKSEKKEEDGRRGKMSRTEPNKPTNESQITNQKWKPNFAGIRIFQAFNY